MGDDGVQAIKRFCNAARQLQTIESSPGVARRKEIRATLNGLKSILHDEMCRTGHTCVPVARKDGNDVYARLVEQKRPPKFTPELAVRLIREITPEELRSEGELHPRPTLPVVLEKCIHKKHLASGTSKTQVVLSRSAERRRLGAEALPRPPPPADLHAAAVRYGETQESYTQLFRQEKLVRKPFIQEKADNEAAVARQLAASAPGGAPQRIRIENRDGGEASEYFIRRKDVTRTKNPGARTVRPLVREAIARTCERLAIPYDLTAQGLQTLQRTDILREIETTLEERVAGAVETKKETKVALTHA